MNQNSLVVIDVWHAMRAHWVVVISSVVVFGVTTGIIAYTMTPVYQTTALLAPAADDNAKGSLGGLLGQFGGIASMAGVSLGAGVTSEQESLAILTSRRFLERFVADEDLLPLLFSDRIDPETGEWLPEFAVPDVSDGYKRLYGAIDAVLDRQTGFITLTIQWTDPELAANWTNGLVARLNELMRAKAIEDANIALEYLDRELGKVSVLEVRQAIYALMEGQIRRIMLANVRDDFALRVLDEAVAPKKFEYVSPRETPMIAAGFVIGLIIGMGLALILWARSNPHENSAADEPNSRA